jgi:hypothetical protein
MAQQYQQQTRATGNAGAGNRPPGGKKGSAGGTGRPEDQLLSFDAGNVHLPPWFVNGLAWTGIGTGIVANLWQIVTSTIAYQHMVTTNSVYLSMKPGGQAGAQLPIFLFSTAVSFVFQLALAFFVFRVTQEMKNTKVETGLKGLDAIKHTAVQVIDHQKALLIFTGIAFLYDTLGDYTFVTIYANDWFIIFTYAAALYAASTVIFSKSLETQWAAAVAYANWKAFTMYSKILQYKLQNMQAKAASEQA